MGKHDSLVGARRPSPRGQPGFATAPSSRQGLLTEWTARPLGRLGRPLLAEIESYLHFFSIARDDTGPVGDRFNTRRRASTIM